MREYDHDHAFWERERYSGDRYGKLLRTIESQIHLIPRPIHELRHAETPPIPLLGREAIFLTLKHYEAGRTPLESTDNMMRAIETAGRHPKAHEGERRLAELVSWTLGLSKPYWAESPDQPRATVIDIGGRKGIDHEQERRTSSRDHSILGCYHNNLDDCT